jgi:uncharacterized protein YhaN
MKLAQLRLQAFGPFSDVELNFVSPGTPPATNLHLIFGLNEAGKSCALRAMIDLRFGIPPRSHDAFVHAPGDLRIAGVFQDATGRQLALMRRKGRGITLSYFDRISGQALPSPEVGREEEQALTGGLEREAFEDLFGLDHARLRTGGRLLLEGQGELGAALFEASAGTRGIAAILTKLDTDAKDLFNPHGRAQSAIINAARLSLEESRRAWKEAQIRPAAWQALYRAHEGAQAALAALDEALAAARRQESTLTELRTVEPLLREHDIAQAELRTLEAIPDLSETAREERLAAEQSFARAEKDRQSAEQEERDTDQALKLLVIEGPLLEHAETIERLFAAIDSVARARVAVAQQGVVIAQLDAKQTTQAARIAPGRPLKELLVAAPSAADRTALDTHLTELRTLSMQRAAQEARIQELNQTEAAAGNEAQVMPDRAARAKLTQALTEARGLGDVSRFIDDSHKSIRMLEDQLRQALSERGVESPEALRAMRPLLDTQIASARSASAHIDEEVRALRTEDVGLETDIERQCRRQRELAAVGEVVTAETLRSARARRDEGWSLIRQVYVEHSREALDACRAFDADQALPEAFEAAQASADRQADLLRSDAARAATYEECAERIETMGARRARITEELSALARRREDWQAAWSRQLADARLPALEPDSLHAWQIMRREALAIAVRLTDARTTQEQIESRALAAATALSSALAGLGRPPQDQALAPLITQAERQEALVIKVEAEQTARAQAAQARQADRARVTSQVQETKTALARHQAAVQAWHVRLFLAPDSPPEAVKARLGELDDLVRASEALADARHRQAHERAVVEAFVVQAQNLARLLGEPVPEPALAEDLGDRLKRRLTESQGQDQERKALLHTRAQAQTAKEKAEADRGAQADVLMRLCAAAGVASTNLLPDREEQAVRKRQTRATVATLRRQLSQASNRSEDDLRASLAGQDAIALDTERERCRVEITRLQEEQIAARSKEEETRRALDTVDSSDQAARAREAMEAAAARYRSAIQPWARLKLAHALLQQSLNRFRERAQAPMVAAASTYFSLMTGGRYPRLVADEVDEKPMLRAEREDGRLISVEAMSEGTADQLYLALRLAALELRRASHQHMPLILDDVLVTSDDERATHILRALARFAEGGQVMLFTHHQHLVNLALGALGDQGVVTHHL